MVMNIGLIDVGLQKVEKRLDLDNSHVYIVIKEYEDMAFCNKGIKMEYSEMREMMWEFGHLF